MDKNDQPGSTNPEDRSHLAKLRRVVEDIHALRREMEQRPGFKPLSDKEIKQAKNAGRP